MSQEIEGIYLASDSEGIKYNLSILKADDLKGLMGGFLSIDNERYHVQGSYKFDDGKWTPANIKFEITPEQNSYQRPHISASVGEFTLTSSKTLTGNLYAESFKQLNGQGKFEDKKNRHNQNSRKYDF
jgi:hypothetical protein